MARPKCDENRERRITIRLTEIEYQILSEETERAGLTFAEYVRHQALFGKIDVHYDIETGNKEIREIRDELHRIGINLNQIARFFNTGGKAGEAVFQDIQNSVSDIFTLGNELKNLINR